MRQWGSRTGDAVICLHGIGQHGGIFEPLAQRLVSCGHFVVAVDLRGHGDSQKDPPWNTSTHVVDLLETLDALQIEAAAWVGHSFGGRLAATLAHVSPERATKLALLDPGLGIPPELAYRSAEVDRLDWSFATVDGAVNALLSSEHVIAAPREIVTAYVEDDIRKGPDGRFRFRFCPSAAVVAWSEAATPPPPIVQLATLLVRPETPFPHVAAQTQRYGDALGELFTVVDVPNGHNVLWESPAETAEAVELFLGPAA